MALADLLRRLLRDAVDKAPTNTAVATNIDASGRRTTVVSDGHTTVVRHEPAPEGENE